MQKQTQQLAHIYAIQNELGLVKIGFAHNPDKRFKSIEASSGLKITASYVSPVCFNFAEIEKALHNQFSAHRKAGEWFDIDFITVKNAIDTHFLTVDAHELTTPALKSLIPISQTQIGTDTVQAVDARTLHQWLEVNTPFSIWIDRRIKEYGFIDGQDFLTILLESTGGRPSTDYLISLDMAKELSMVERTTKGKEARQYFIACEKALRNPGHSLDENTKAFLYAAVRQVVQETMQPAKKAISQKANSNPFKQDFVDFINQLEIGVRYDKYVVFNQLKRQCPGYKHIKQRSFTKWVRSLDQCLESESNGKSYFTLTGVKPCN